MPTEQPSSVPMRPQSDIDLTEFRLARDWSLPQVADQLAWENDSELASAENYVPGWQADDPEADDRLDALDRELTAEKEGGRR